MDLGGPFWYNICKNSTLPHIYAILINGSFILFRHLPNLMAHLIRHILSKMMHNLVHEI